MLSKIQGLFKDKSILFKDFIWGRLSLDKLFEITFMAPHVKTKFLTVRPQMKNLYTVIL